MSYDSLVMSTTGPGSIVVVNAELDGPESAVSAAEIIWESSNEEIVSVGNGGIFYAHAAGTAVVTAKVEDGPSVSCDVDVSADLKRLTLPSEYSGLRVPAIRKWIPTNQSMIPDNPALMFRPIVLFVRQ